MKKTVNTILAGAVAATLAFSMPAMAQQQKVKELVRKLAETKEYKRLV